MLLFEVGFNRRVCKVNCFSSLCTSCSSVCKGTEYALGDLVIRICRLVLKPGEEVKGIMLDVEYFPINSSAEGCPVLQVRTNSVLHLDCVLIDLMCIAHQCILCVHLYTAKALALLRSALALASC